MLASLLPGLRDLRTPLTVGYLWLICGWLWFRDVLPRRSEAGGAIADLYDLGEALPTAASLAAGSLLAYFLGSIVVLDPASAQWLDSVRPNRTAWEAVADRFRIRLDDGHLDHGVGPRVSPERYAAAVAAWQRAAPPRTTKHLTLQANADLEVVRAELAAQDRDIDLDAVRREAEQAQDRLDPHGHSFRAPAGGTVVYRAWGHSSWRKPGGWRRLRSTGNPEGNALVEWRGRQLPIADATVGEMSALALAALYALRDELPDLATWLLIERPAVFDRYDRLLAEASIRINMVPPLVALVATFGLRAHWMCWAGLAVCAAILYQGFVLRSRAMAVVLDSVAAQLVESPTMAAVAEALRGGPTQDRPGDTGGAVAVPGQQAST